MLIDASSAASCPVRAASVRQRVRREVVEAVSRLVHQCLHVVRHADGVHEDERAAAEGKIVQ
jgi:hypothetical protein